MKFLIDAQLPRRLAVHLQSLGRDVLLPQGVSGAIKRLGVKVPFREADKHGAIPLGGAVLTSAGGVAIQGCPGLK